MRNRWDRDAHQMIVDIGPLGCPVSGGHGHADLLSIQCAIFGEPCLVDAGNYCYTPQADWRDYFRSTEAHNTVSVDGQSQSEAAGPFGWRSRPRVRLREWHSTPELDFLDAEHDACSRDDGRHAPPPDSVRQAALLDRRRRSGGHHAAQHRPHVSVRADARHARSRSLGARADAGRPRAVGRTVHLGAGAPVAASAGSCGRSAAGWRPTTAAASLRRR